MFKVTLPSDLGRKLQALDQYERSLSQMNDAIARNAAFYFRRKVKERIDLQDLPWEPLSEDYLKEKQRLGQDLRIWIARGILRRNLKVVRFGQANYALTVPPNVNYPEGISVRQVLLINEFGTIDNRIPARPLFRPVRRIVQERLIEEVGKSNQRIIQALSKTYNLGGVQAIAPEWLGD